MKSPACVILFFVLLLLLLCCILFDCIICYRCKRKRTAYVARSWLACFVCLGSLMMMMVYSFFFPLLVRSFIVPFQSISKVLLHSAALERRRGNKEQKQNSIADVLSILCVVVVVVVLVLHSMLYILEWKEEEEESRRDQWHFWPCLYGSSLISLASGCF